MQVISPLSHTHEKIQSIECAHNVIPSSSKGTSVEEICFGFISSMQVGCSNSSIYMFVVFYLSSYV